jgi:chloride channel 3/4/5
MSISHNGRSSALSNQSPDDAFVRDLDDTQDELDFFDDEDSLHDSHSPTHANSEPLSFKRKQKQSRLFSQPARLFSALTGASSSATPQRSPPPGAHPHAPERLDTLGPSTGTSKDGFPLDWYVEGPGRRVGYEDLTAIDWIFEYTKERQRLRVLASSASGLLGYVKEFLDASQVWVVLVLTGIAVGSLAAGIDVTTDWLGDIKYGYCASDDGGAFYLSKTSCCIGYEEQSKCTGWKPWSVAFGITSAGGKWFLEYLVYLVFAVGVGTLVRRGCR